MAGLTMVQRIGTRATRAAHWLTASPKLRQAVGYAAHYARQAGLNRSEGMFVLRGSKVMEPRGIPTDVSQAVFNLLNGPEFKGLPESVRDKSHIDQATRVFTSRTFSHRISSRDIEAYAERLGLKGQDVADLRRWLEKDETIITYSHAERLRTINEDLAKALLAKEEQLEEVDPINSFLVLNEPLQDARELTSINQLRRVEAIDPGTRKPIPGVEIYRVFRSDLPAALRAIYDQRNIQYLFYAVDRRPTENGGSGLRYSYAVTTPVYNPVLGKEATLGGCRSRDYSQPIDAPVEIEKLHQVWKQLYDTLRLAEGMLTKSAAGGADVRGPEKEWEYGITLGGGKSVEHQPSEWMVANITAEQVRDDDPQKILKLHLIAHRDARDLLKGTVIDTLCAWELAPLTAEDMDNDVEPRLLTMGKKTKYLVGDHRLGLKGEYPTTITAANVFQDIKALIEAGLWTGIPTLKEMVIWVEGYGGVSSNLIDHLIKAGVKKIVITELDNQTPYERFGKRPGFEGREFAGRTKTEYIQQKLIPAAAQEGVEVILIEPSISPAEVRGLTPAQAKKLRGERLAQTRLAILQGNLQGEVNVYSPNAGGDVIKTPEAKAIARRGIWVAGAANNVIEDLSVEKIVGLQVVPSSLVNDGGVIAASAYLNGDTAETLTRKTMEICPAKAVAVFRLAQEWGLNFSEAFRKVTDILIAKQRVKDRERRYAA